MPDAYAVHQDAVLSNMAVAYSQEGTFIADKVLPVLNVAKESDKFYTFDRTDTTTLPFTQRADGAEAPETSWDVSTDTYQCEEYALKDIVTDRARKNADSPLDMEGDTTRFLTELIMLDRERRVAAAVFNGSTFSSYTAALSGNDRWDVYTDADSDPQADVQTGKNSVLLNTGKMANTVIMGYEVFEDLILHPNVLDIIKYTGTSSKPATVNETTLAEAFGVEQVLVGRSSYNSADEGATASYAFNWGKSVMIAYIAPTPPRKGLTLGATFRAQPFSVSRWREDRRKGDAIEVSIVDDEKIIAAACGYYFTTVVS